MAQPTVTNLDVSLDAVADFCRRWNIVELALFGSILRDDFGPDSDVDVLITVRPGQRLTFANLGAMQEDLELLLGRTVDLLTRKSVEDSPNYLRRRHILGTARVIYAER